MVSAHNFATNPGNLTFCPSWLLIRDSFRTVGDEIIRSLHLNHLGASPMPLSALNPLSPCCFPGEDVLDEVGLSLF